MDTTKTTTHVSLCAGYGGIDLGLKRAVPSLRTIAFSEIEAFACANLVSKMEAGHLDPAPIWTDVKTFPWGKFRDRVGILSGGYPCQPFSAAGKRLGKEDPRHLWPWIADGIRAMRPRLCFFENVEGHISLGLRDVIEELASIGYETTWGIFSASEVGAPHQRKRVFILAHDSSAGLQRLGTDPARSSGRIETWPSRPGQPQHEWEPPRVVAHSSSEQPQRGRDLRKLESSSGVEQSEAQERQWCRNAAGDQSSAVANSLCCGGEGSKLLHSNVSPESGWGDIEGVEDTGNSRLDGFSERHEKASQERSANKESNRNRELQNGPQGSSGVKSVGDSKCGGREGGNGSESFTEVAPPA